MPTNYTVKSGDTLGAIAKSFGVDLGSITGYSSGNPNLIRPGEVLSFGGSSAGTSGTSGTSGTGSPTTSPTTTSGETSGGTSFVEQLQKQLMEMSGIISSDSTKIESGIKDIISGVNKGNEASKGVIKSQYDRAIEDAKKVGEQDVINELESQRGFATVTAVINNTADRAAKNVKDLEQRKQELLLQGDATAASKITELQLKEMEMEQETRKTGFQNLLAMGNFALQANQESRLAKAQTFQEKSKMSEIALKYGIELKEGDTLDTVISRATPFANEEQRLEMIKTKAEISKLNSEAAKALKGESDSLDPNVITLIATAAIKKPEVLGFLKDPQQASAVVLKMDELSNVKTDTTLEDTDAQINSYRQRGYPAIVVKGEIAKDTTLDSKAKSEMIKRVDQIYSGRK